VSSHQVHHLERLFHSVRASNLIENADIWSIKTQRSDIDETREHIMTNYFSIGTDAKIAYDLAECRAGRCGCCFYCVCMGMACYVPVAFRSMCGRRSIRSYCSVDIDTLNADGEITPRALQSYGREKTVVFLAIPSMYAGLDPWRNHAPRSMGDGLFETVMQGGVWSLGFFQLGCNTGRPVCQGSRAVITASEPVYYQIDGEGYVMNGPGTLVLSKGGSYPLIRCARPGLQPGPVDADTEHLYEELRMNY
jgi:hypothetical protein